MSRMNVYLLMLIAGPIAANANMDCAGILPLATSYQAAKISCTACNTTSNNFTFEEAESICPGAAASWCYNNDPSCSNPTSGCTKAVINCKAEKPNRPDKPDKPYKKTDPSTADTNSNSTRPQSLNPFLQTHNQQTETDQRKKQESDDEANPWSSTASSRDTSYKPPTQLPGQPCFPGSSEPRCVSARQALKLGPQGNYGGKNDPNHPGSTGQRPQPKTDEFGNTLPGSQTAAKVAGKIPIVPNNTGGNIPQGDESSQTRLPEVKPKPAAGSPYRSPGSLAANGRPSGSSSGGYPANSDSNSDYESGSNVRGPASDSGDYQSVDLSSYLPGGQNDHRRRLLMGEVPSSGEIHNRTVNIFNRITIRMAEFCANGELLDCR